MLDPIAKANGTIVTVDRTNKLLLLAGNLDRLSELETLIRRMDIAPVPSRTMELTAYLLAADGAATAAQNIPAPLEPAIKQLRSTFNYKTYQLLDTIFIRNRTGEAGTTKGFLPAPASELAHPERGGYIFSYGSSYLSRDEKGEVIHLDHLVLDLPNGSILTNVDLRSGQIVVVGKTNYERGGSSALIAVITARLID